jgi:hypothetical protein
MRGSWRTFAAFVAGVISWVACYGCFVRFRAIQDVPPVLFHFRTHPTWRIEWVGPAAPWATAGVAAFLVGVVLFLVAWLSALGVAGRARRDGIAALSAAGVVAAARGRG